MQNILESSYLPTRYNMKHSSEGASGVLARNKKSAFLEFVQIYNKNPADIGKSTLYPQPWDAEQLIKNTPDWACVGQAAACSQAPRCNCAASATFRDGQGTESEYGGALKRLSWPRTVCYSRVPPMAHTKKTTYLGPAVRSNF